jgi:hypothetical protein
MRTETNATNMTNGTNIMGGGGVPRLSDGDGSNGNAVVMDNGTVSECIFSATILIAPSSPKVLETVRRHRGVDRGVEYVPMPEPMLQAPRVMAIVGELVPTCMPEHVGMDGEWHGRD